MNSHPPPFPGQRDGGETIQSSGDHLLVVVNDLLGFSRIESGKFEVKFSPFSLLPGVSAPLRGLALVARLG